MSGLVWIQAVRRFSDVPDGVISIFVSGPELIVKLARVQLKSLDPNRAPQNVGPDLVMSPMELSPLMHRLLFIWT